ncbi:MAG: 5'-methylthioadenosine/adenosylhomocysteine nucleosidase [Clostridia bacterium]|nr:5'-methylthioadenosine/adenosylhomocysteine nucleosidase [Clostridia bacterium]
MERYDFGIIAAMQEEFDAIYEIMSKTKQIVYYEKEFMCGKIGDKNCILVLSGVGKVNAARTTQLMLDKFEVNAVINVGSAGALNEELGYGDIVLSTALVQHDFDITCFGHPKGYISDIGVEIKADDKLIEMFEKTSMKVVKGTIATGDQFYNSPEIKRALRETFHAECDDMEGAAVAQVCMLCHVPFVVIRSISDKPKSEEKVDFYEYLELASKRCAKMIEEVAKNHK